VQCFTIFITTYSRRSKNHGLRHRKEEERKEEKKKKKNKKKKKKREEEKKKKRKKEKKKRKKEERKRGRGLKKKELTRASNCTSFKGAPSSSKSAMVD